jgi:hypothetical protein
MDRKRNDDDLAYGRYSGGESGEQQGDGATGDRGLFSDVYGRIAAHRPGAGAATQGGAAQGGPSGQVCSLPPLTFVIRLHLRAASWTDG